MQFTRPAISVHWLERATIPLHTKAMQCSSNSLRQVAWTISALLIVALLASCADQPRRVTTTQAAPTELDPPLVTGRSLSRFSPEGMQSVGSLPINMITSADGKYAIVSDAGWTQSLWSVSLSDGRAVSHIDYPNRITRVEGDPNTGVKRRFTTSAGLYFGLATSRGTIYAAQGGHDAIAVLHLADDGTLQQQASIATRTGDFPAGVAIDERGHLFVSNNASSEKIDPKENPGSVAVYATESGKELGRFVFQDSYYGTSNYPLAIAARRDGSRAYVASERDDAVYVLNTTDPTSPSLAATIATGAHPVALLFNKDQSRLFVANSLSDTVAVVDTASNRVVSTILLRPAAARDLYGSTPTNLSLSGDEKTLYVTLADMNAVAIVDLDKPECRGYIPAGWYPTGAAVTSDGKQLLVTNAKGPGRRNPNRHFHSRMGQESGEYILDILEGNVQLLSIPTDLKESTETVLKNNRIETLADKSNPLEAIGSSAGQITHVIYVIKENRTYDQVLGDLPQGNGDPVLTLFGRDVTPNQHALAERFVLLDNLYAAGEVSGDGWCWSTQAAANAYVSRNVPYGYSGRGRPFDYEGQNNTYITGGFPAKSLEGKPLSTRPAYADGAKPIPDVAAAGAHLWDVVQHAGFSYRNYGFFLASGFVDNYPTSVGLQPPGHDLAGVSDIDFRRFDLDYPDSDAPEILFKQTGDQNCLYSKREYGLHKAQSRFAEWKTEFDQYLKRDPSGKAVPALMTVRLPHDHTQGMSGGKHSPRSEVADNDYAVGQLIETLSHSPIWNHCAVFVIEDDAQDGPDHVDAHRMPGFVVSPFIKRHSVDHRFYNTNSILRSIELLLGVAPMNLNDAIATPILNWEKPPANNEPYAAILPDKKYIAEINTPRAQLPQGDPRIKLTEQSERMNFDQADKAPAGQLNQIIWKSVRGSDTKMPPPRKSLAAFAPDDDDDD